MGELKCERKTVIKVEYGEMERYIKEVTGHKHEIVAAEEARNDMVLDYEGIGEDEMDEFDYQEYREWLKTGKFWAFNTRTILEGMWADGHLKAGDYYIEIYW